MGAEKGFALQVKRGSGAEAYPVRPLLGSITANDSMVATADYGIRTRVCAYLHPSVFCNLIYHQRRVAGGGTIGRYLISGYFFNIYPGHRTYPILPPTLAYPTYPSLP